MRNQTATIYEIREYAREKGEQVSLITAKTPIDGGLVEYMGQSQGEAKGPAGQTMPIPFAFPIEAESIEDAFENFNEAKQAAWPEVAEQFRQQMRQQAGRIQIARSVNAVGQRAVGGNGNGKPLIRR